MRSTPETPEEVEGFLRGRTEIYLLLLAAIWGGVHLINLGMSATDPAHFAGFQESPFFWAQPAIVAVLLGLWLLARASPSGLVVDGAELLGTLISAAGLAVLVVAFDASVVSAPEAAAEGSFFVALNAFTATLTARAALVPSRKPRTIQVGLLAAVPVMGAAFTQGWLRGEPLLECTGFLVSAAIWVCIALAISATISGVIYGLADRMQDIMRLGQYTLDEKIGEGGMGVVYRASHALLRRPTAIKVLPPDRAGETALARFEREVQLTSRLAHPNTVAVYDYGKTPDGMFYYAMEYLDGVDLDVLVREDGAQEPARVLHLLRQAASALAEAHEVGLIHRDVKPSNLILCRRPLQPDLLKVVDFGLVRRVAASQDETRLSTAETLTGTPLYIAPEQITDPDDVDARTDVYALGAVAYTLLTGRPPFEGKTIVEICGHHLHSAAVPPSVRAATPIPASIDALVLACLAKDPADRPASALELIRAIDACVAEAGARWGESAAEAWWSERGDALRAARARGPRRDGDREPHVLTVAAGAVDRHVAPPA